MLVIDGNHPFRIDYYISVSEVCQRIEGLYGVFPVKSLNIHYPNIKTACKEDYIKEKKVEGEYMGFSMKEASECLGVTSHTIRYYEKEGLLPYIQRDQYGNRIFEQKDLDWMAQMSCFRATGMTIAALKQIVDLAVQGDSTLSERKLILENHKLELQKSQLGLDKAFEAVNSTLSIYDSKLQQPDAPQLSEITPIPSGYGP